MGFQLKFLLLTTREIKETSLFLSHIIFFLLYFLFETENALDFDLSALSSHFTFIRAEIELRKSPNIISFLSFAYSGRHLGDYKTGQMLVVNILQMCLLP